MRIFDKILFVFLAIPSLCFAGSHSVQITRGVVTGGTTEPATGTVVLGSTSTTSYTEEYFFPISYEEIFNKTTYTAAWSESATTTTLAKIGVYIRGHAGGYCKVNLRASDLSLIATSAAKLMDYEGSLSLQEFDFSSPPTITKGTAYIMTFMCDTDYAAVVGMLPSGEDMSYGTNGSYASPAATLTETTSAYAGIGAFYGKH